MMVTAALQRATDRAATIERLRQSLEGVLTAVAITPAAWHYRSPEGEMGLAWLGPWSVAENLAHLAVYETLVAAPILEAIAAGRDGRTEVTSVIESDYEADWQQLAQLPIDQISRRLMAARARQIAAIAAMSDERFHALATTLWANSAAAPGHSAAWVAIKTVQHTWEHGNSILQLALFAPLYTTASLAD